MAHSLPARSRFGTGLTAALGLVILLSAASLARGQSPYSVAVADLNHDGKVDLVTTDSSQSAVAIRLGNGDGTFQAPVSYPLADAPAAVAVADFNGDGKLDLAVCTATGVTVLMGKGDGTFAPGAVYSGYTNPASIVAADFGRGRIDLAVTQTYGGEGSVNLFLGGGNGTFIAPCPYPQSNPVVDFCAGQAYRGNFIVGEDPFSMTAGDFNRDGKLDLAVTDAGRDVNGVAIGSGDVAVLIGNGDGTFRPPVYYPTDYKATSVAAADVNGDGKLDLVASNQDMTLNGMVQATGDVSVLLGAGDGTFHPAVNYPVGGEPASVAVGDFTGDGILDVAVANPDVSTVEVLPGKGDGTFGSPRSTPMNGIPYALAAADFNGDGRPDLAVATTDGVSVLLTGVTSEPAGAPQSGDVNGDGSVTVGDAILTLQIIAGIVNPSAARKQAADVNGDGKVNVKDAILILEMVAHLRPCGGAKC